MDGHYCSYCYCDTDADGVCAYGKRCGCFICEGSAHFAAHKASVGDDCACTPCAMDADSAA